MAGVRSLSPVVIASRGSNVGLLLKRRIGIFLSICTGYYQTSRHSTYKRFLEKIKGFVEKGLDGEEEIY